MVLVWYSIDAYNYIITKLFTKNSTRNINHLFFWINDKFHRFSFEK